ncbi:hypothetical protein F2Q69_00030319 [Brassica cretica]|uniref:RNase H type-1 domain-containing protein n=1 Tax=Brassica cretica TaxID=69181 RepID=A0A8S9RWT2_BRACR|nr:hypothetical protein F2Q69_00030319 [Brassica cretica]
MLPSSLVKEDESDLYVSDLILIGTWKWNLARIKEILPALAEEIMTLRPTLTGANDSYIWYPVASGSYSANSWGAKEWSAAQLDSDASNNNTKVPTLPLLPSMPEETTTCNTDAAWNPISREAGLGWILSNQDTSTLQRSQFQTHVQSAIAAEALAIRAALSHAIHLGVTNRACQSHRFDHQSKESSRSASGYRSPIPRLSLSVVFRSFQGSQTSLQILSQKPHSVIWTPLGPEPRSRFFPITFSICRKFDSNISMVSI